MLDSEALSHIAINKVHVTMLQIYLYTVYSILYVEKLLRVFFIFAEKQCFYNSILRMLVEVGPFDE